jgi:CheY-like chemotaxis protein
MVHQSGITSIGLHRIELEQQWSAQFAVNEFVRPTWPSVRKEEDVMQRAVVPEVTMQRVVVIAEDRQAKQTVRAVLANPECEVLETADVQTGLDWLRKPGVACVIVDCCVRAMSRDMRHLLQYSAGMAGIPALWITPYGAREPLVHELGLSRLNLLPKPFSPLQLLERVQQSIWIGPYVPQPSAPAVSAV